MDKRKFIFLLKRWVVVIAVYLSGYLFLNILTVKKEVVSILTIPWDEQIPILPNFIYPYVAAYFIFTFGLWPICWRQTKKDNEKTMRAALFIILISFLIYFFFPTEVPWSKIENGTLAIWILNFLHPTQQVFNAFPSLHTAFITFVNCLLWRQKKSLGIAFLPLTIIIILSTIFTKQHVIVDLPAGIFLSLLSVWIFFRKEKSKI